MRGCEDKKIRRYFTNLLDWKNPARRYFRELTYKLENILNKILNRIFKNYI